MREPRRAAPAAEGAFPLPKRQSLSQSIADSIAEGIATRHLTPGERIVETALAERLGVSRVPIREALKVLHAQGILSGGGHRGYRVASFDQATVEKVFEVRLMLEAFQLRDSIGRWRAGDTSPAALDEVIARMDAAARAGDARASLRADLEFHRVICLASGNPIAATLWEAIARHVLIIFSLDRYRDTDLFAVADQHRAFRRFIAGQIRTPGSFDTLRTALEDHLLQVARSKRRQAARTAAE